MAPTSVPAALSTYSVNDDDCCTNPEMVNDHYKSVHNSSHIVSYGTNSTTGSYGATPASSTTTVASYGTGSYGTVGEYGTIGKYINGTNGQNSSTEMNGMTQYGSGVNGGLNGNNDAGKEGDGNRGGGRNSKDPAIEVPKLPLNVKEISPEYNKLLDMASRTSDSPLAKEYIRHRRESGGAAFGGAAFDDTPACSGDEDGGSSSNSTNSMNNKKSWWNKFALYFRKINRGTTINTGNGIIQLVETPRRRNKCKQIAIYFICGFLLFSLYLWFRGIVTSSDVSRWGEKGYKFATSHIYGESGENVPSIGGIGNTSSPPQNEGPPTPYNKALRHKHKKKPSPSETSAAVAGTATTGDHGTAQIPLSKGQTPLSKTTTSSHKPDTSIASDLPLTVAPADKAIPVPSNEHLGLPTKESTVPLIPVIPSRGKEGDIKIPGSYKAVPDVSQTNKVESGAPQKRVEEPATTKEAIRKQLDQEQQEETKAAEKLARKRAREAALAVEAEKEKQKQEALHDAAKKLEDERIAAEKKKAAELKASIDAQKAAEPAASAQDNGSAKLVTLTETPEERVQKRQAEQNLGSGPYTGSVYEGRPLEPVELVHHPPVVKVNPKHTKISPNKDSLTRDPLTNMPPVGELTDPLKFLCEGIPLYNAVTDSHVLLYLFPYWTSSSWDKSHVRTCFYDHFWPRYSDDKTKDFLDEDGKPSPGFKWGHFATVQDVTPFFRSSPYDASPLHKWAPAMSASTFTDENKSSLQEHWMRENWGSSIQKYHPILVDPDTNTAVWSGMLFQQSAGSIEDFYSVYLWEVQAAEEIRGKHLCGVALAGIYATLRRLHNAEDSPDILKKLWSPDITGIDNVPRDPLTGVPHLLKKFLIADASWESITYADGVEGSAPEALKKEHWWWRKSKSKRPMLPGAMFQTLKRVTGSGFDNDDMKISPSYEFPMVKANPSDPNSKEFFHFDKEPHVPCCNAAVVVDNYLPLDIVGPYSAFMKRSSEGQEFKTTQQPIQSIGFSYGSPCYKSGHFLLGGMWDAGNVNARAAGGVGQEPAVAMSGWGPQRLCFKSSRICETMQDWRYTQIYDMGIFSLDPVVQDKVIADMESRRLPFMPRDQWVHNDDRDEEEGKVLHKQKCQEQGIPAITADGQHTWDGLP